MVANNDAHLELVKSNSNKVEFLSTCFEELVRELKKTRIDEHVEVNSKTKMKQQSTVVH